MKDEKDFFRFYEDGFEETKLSYQKIIEAFVVAGILEEGTTLENVVEKCKVIDAEEVKATEGQVRESNIGLQGYFASLGYSEDKLKDDEEAKKLYEKCGISSEKMSNKAEERLKALYKAIGQKGLEALGEIKMKGTSDKEDEGIIDASAFLGSLATGPYFPRQTCFSASQLMGLGRIMQIGCSQGKTSVVAMTTYEQLKRGKKIFSTSSAPGLVPENYDEARDFYEKMGIAEDFCAISQNASDNIEHIVLFHKGKKYEVRADGDIYEEVVKEENGKKQKKMEPIEKIDKSLLDELGLKLSKDPEKSYDFEESVKSMMASKGIIMGDTITLGKYQHLMPDRNKDGVIENSFLIVDEADAELYDTQPQEIIENEFPEEIAKDRWENRRRATEEIKNFKGDLSELEKIAKEKNIDLDFLVDAYEAKTKFANQETWKVEDGKVFVLNLNTNVMIPASQGLQEAILAMNSETRDPKVKPEREVTDETNIPELFANFETVSLMSGTMEDKGMSKFSTEEEKTLYNDARKAFLLKCGVGVQASARDGVIEWKLVTPKTRQEKGNAIVNLDGIEYDDKSGQISTMKGFSLGEGNWEDYINKNGEALEEKWRETVENEAKRRSEDGQPVMVSVYGDRVPLKDVEVYTDKHQIGKEHEYNKDKYMASTVEEDGKETGEIAQFDDFYGRGYTFKFLKTDETGQILTKESNGKTKPIKQEKGGHVLITSLPQNSRNLEQFLFRVARGGDKGSSSMIISPADPKLIEYLKTLEPTKANKYFEDVMNGNIEIQQVVFDIYPKETVKIFSDKAKEIEIIKAYDDARLKTVEDILAVSKLVKEEALCEIYKKEYIKQQQKMMKLHRIAGMPLDKEKAQCVQKVYLNTVRQLILDKKVNKPTEIIGILPPNITLEELQELIPEDKELTSKLISLNEKINAHIILQQSDENPLQNNEPTNKNSTANTRKPDEIEKAANGDLGYNEDEMIKALAAIRTGRLEEQDPSKKAGQQTRRARPIQKRRTEDRR